jgi:hypothetical protein
MIRYALICDAEDEFEAWFSSSADFDVQVARDLVECPACGSKQVRKAPMAPAVARTREAPSPDQVRRAVAQAIKSHIRESFDYVGERFAEEARRLHESDVVSDKPIWGEASPQEARALIEDGVPVAPLPAEFAPEPPRKLN